MAELENLLLQAAGRTGTSTRKNQSHSHSRWRHEGSTSESKENDSDNSKFDNRRRSGSRIPLKKSNGCPPEKENMRNWANENDKRFSGGDESDSAPSIGSDLYKDEADKEELSKLSELKREFILAERSALIDDYRLKKKARSTSTELEKPGKDNPPPSLLPHIRSSLRTEKPASKTDALNELRAKRMRLQEPESYRRLRESSVSSSRNKNFVPIPEIDSSESDDGREGKLRVEIDMDDNLDDLLTSKARPITYEDAKEITIRRSKLAKWLMEPFFEDIVGGCFVRIGIGMTRNGPKYRLCVVKNVDSTDLNRRYKLEGLTTYKYLNCVWGSDASAARWQMAMVSDSPPTEEEFNEWFMEMERNGSHIPCLQDVDDKKESFQKIKTFVYSPDTVKMMLKEKKSASSRPIKVAVQKVLLKKEIETAECNGDEDEVERLRAKLKELDDSSRQVKPGDTRAARLMEMNNRNRIENYKIASEDRSFDPSLKFGDTGYDPFSRRWTRPSNNYSNNYAKDGNGGTSHGGNGHVVDAAKPGEEGEVRTVEPMDEAEGEEKLSFTRVPVDFGAKLNSLHDFDLPISLAGLNKYGGAQGIHLAFMERKQKIEATVGHRVPDDYGRRHVLTLSISDYKRRRGLL